MSSTPKNSSWLVYEADTGALIMSVNGLAPEPLPFSGQVVIEGVVDDLNAYWFNKETQAIEKIV